MLHLPPPLDFPLCDSQTAALQIMSCSANGSMSLYSVFRLTPFLFFFVLMRLTYHRSYFTGFILYWRYTQWLSDRFLSNLTYLSTFVSVSDFLFSDVSEKNTNRTKGDLHNLHNKNMSVIMATTSCWCPTLPNVTKEICSKNYVRDCWNAFFCPTVLQPCGIATRNAPHHRATKWTIK